MPHTSDDSLRNVRHSCAHVLAQAVLKLRPDTKIAIGPPIDAGCYYDFLFAEPISEDDFPKIEKEMRARIYVAVFLGKEELQAHLAMVEESKKRDHRKLGRELDLFAFSEMVGPGLPLWTPKGTVIADELEKLAKEMEERGGYLRVRTPHVAKGALYERTGHLAHYRASMFPPMRLEDEG